MFKSTFFSLISLLVVLLALSFEKSLSSPVTGLYRRMDSPPGTPPHQGIPQLTSPPAFSRGRREGVIGESLAIAQPDFSNEVVVPGPNAAPAAPVRYRGRHDRYEEVRARMAASGEPIPDPSEASTSGASTSGTRERKRKCEICLQKKVLTKECYYQCQTDNVKHHFCEKCTLEWETKGEHCPTCRAPQNDEKLIRLIDSKNINV